MVKAFTAEEKLGSVRIEGKVTQGKSVIVLDLLVNGDGEGGGVFVQQGNVIKIERVGTLLYLNAPKRFWSTHASAAQTKAYGGKWIELSALDSRLRVLRPVPRRGRPGRRRLPGLHRPVDGEQADDLRRTTRSSSSRTRSPAHGTRSTGLMYIGTASPHDVYKIVDDTPDQTSTLVFNNYGKAVPLTVPPEPINVS